MPNSITHYLFAIDCFDNINIENIKKLISDNLDIYTLGCQGPNFFTYYNYLPLISKSNIGDISDLIHNTNINEFFKNMISYSTNNSCMKHVFNNPNFNEVTMAYIYGFLTHYVLDKSMHPYIYNLQFNLKNQYKFKTNKLLHKSIETHIDALLLNEFVNLEPHQFHKHTDINISKDELIIICDMYQFLIRKIFSRSVLYDDISKCIETFKKTEQILNSSNGFYTKSYVLMKKKLSKSSFVDGKVYSQHKNCVNNLLNYNKDVWTDPFSNREYNYSLVEIYNKAIFSFQELVYILNLYLDNKKSMIELLLEIDDKSFITNQNYKIKYKNI